MDYEWDPDKAAANLATHQVDFADAAVALEDELALTREDPDAQGEERYVSLAADPQSRILVVAYTWRGETVRIISARRATSRERRRYEGR